MVSAVVAAKNDLASINTGSQWASYFRLDELSQIASARTVSDTHKAALETAADRLNSSGDYSADQKKFVSRSSLSRLGIAVSAVQEITSEPLSAREATVEQLKSVVQAVNDYEYNSNASAAAELRRVLSASPVSRIAGQLTSTVREQFLYDNFRASVSESLIRRLLSDSRVEKGLINDCLFGARVVGDQWTSSDLSVDLVPSIGTARFVLSLNGSVDSKTRGITKQGHGVHEGTSLV